MNIGTSNQINLWKLIFEKYYQEAFQVEDKTFNLTGWNSSYTGQPFPSIEMRDWVNDTVDRIVCCKPKRIYEIGSGTGLLLFSLIHECIEYCGTDFSENAIEYLKQHVPLSANHVNLLHQPADNFSELTTGKYDTLLLNSVVQYFPNLSYLQKVLEGAITNISSEGTIFIGDVRSRPLLEAFHASVEIWSSANDVDLTLINQNIQTRMKNDMELAVDPEFFHALKEQFPKISHVEIRYKKGWYQNELTRFRYDVFIHIEKASQNISKQYQWTYDLLDIEKLLKRKLEVIQLKKVPNFSVIWILEALKVLKEGKLDSIGSLRQELNDTVQVVPWEQIYLLGGEDYYVEPLLESRRCDECSLFFIRKDVEQDKIFPNRDMQHYP